MMPTSEGRREVAERLRDAAHTNASLDVTIVTAILGTIDEVHRPIASVIADLMDPTCHDFGGEEGTNGEGYDFACSACGYVCDLPEPFYCPNCGARVIDVRD